MISFVISPSRTTEKIKGRGDEKKTDYWKVWRERERERGGGALIALCRTYSISGSTINV